MTVTDAPTRPPAALRADPPTVSVIICCYTRQRWNLLQQAIESVLSQVPAPLELILCVDYNDALEARLQADPRLVVVPNGEEQGLSGARNSGINVARGDIVAFLDDDAAAEPGWLGALQRWYADPKVLGVGGKILPAWGAHGRPSGFPEEFDWVVGCTYRGMPENAAVVRNVIGASMSFRRSIVDEIGGFSSEVGRIGTRPLGCEETEFCIRATAHLGGVILYDPDSIVRHHVPPDRRGWRYFLSRCYSEGLSKARVSRLVGSDDALASERRHVRQVLVAATLRDVRSAVLRLDSAAAHRAVRTPCGVLAAVLGYARGSIGGES